jgi:peptidoglycan biosynthesis protein MviN/MurJ (putative lipid II flippase)
MNSPSSFSREDLLQIARSQKAIISLILVNLLVVVGLVWSVMALGPDKKSAAVIVSAGRWIVLVLNLIGVVFIYRMAKALHQTAWVFAVAAFVPCVSLITLLLINQFATGALRRHGVRVGLMGAVKSDLENLASAPDTPPVI